MTTQTEIAAFAKEIVAQMTETERADYDRTEWADGISQLTWDHWGDVTIAAVLDAVDAELASA
jgi:hypothetical protein